MLAGRRNRNTDMALGLAGAVARILELAPTYQGSPSYPFRGTERTFDKAFIQKHARLRAQLFDRESTDPPPQEVSARVRAAMRTIVVAGGGRKIHPDDDSLIWRGRFRWDDTDDSQRVSQALFKYLEHCCQEKDLVGLGDALLVTSVKWHFASNVQKAAFLDILISSLGTGSTRLRHIAIQAAWDNRTLLSAAENTQHAEMGEKLLTTFSQALFTSISLHIDSANDASDGADTTQDLGDVNPNDDSDRDSCYLRLIFTLSNSSDWVPSIVRDGHLDRCLVLLPHMWRFYLAVILLRIEADKRVDSARLDAITEEQWQEMTYKAWRYLPRWGLKDFIDILPALAERTVKCLSDSRHLPRLREDVVEVLDELKREGVREDILSAVGTVVEAIDERRR